jgi:hypothetical protein
MQRMAWFVVFVLVSFVVCGVLDVAEVILMGVVD